MKITKFKGKNEKECIFCTRELGDGPFCEVNTRLAGNMYSPRFIHRIHLTCGYKFLKKLNNPNSDDKKTIKKLEERYIKEIAVENLG